MVFCWGFFSGNESSGYLYFFCFEAYPCVLDLSAFLVFVLLNSMVSGSVCLSDLISFENWWQQWESRASHCLTCAESGDGSSVTGMWFILLRSHQLLRGDGDTLFMFWHLCSRNVSITFLLKVWRRLCSALFEKYIVLKLCWKETIPATLNNPLPKPRITWALLPANGKNLSACLQFLCKRKWQANFGGKAIEYYQHKNKNVIVFSR